MRVSVSHILSLAATALPLCLAQTHTSCDPTKRSCPADPALNTADFSSYFTAGSLSNNRWTTTAGAIAYGSSGAEFTINKQGDAPTIQTDFYIFFGLVEVKLKAAPGTGVVSSIVMESDDLDEIDWEFLGGNAAQTQTNYFSKGNTATYDRAVYHPVSAPQSTFHTYTVNWTSSQLTWLIDGTVIRTLNYAEANGGTSFPQTPMRVKLGSWAGGDPSNSPGTIAWSGGETDYTAAPFTMYVESVRIVNYHPASSYVYDGTSGSWQSIRVIGGSAPSPAIVQNSATAPTSTSTSVALKSTSAIAATIVESSAMPSTTTSSSFGLNEVSTKTAVAVAASERAGIPSAAAGSSTRCLESWSPFLLVCSVLGFATV